MTYRLTVDNIKCGGCANTIVTRLTALDSVDDCQVDIEKGVITVSADETSRAEVIQLLLNLGYPETGSTEGLNAAKAKAKSFVSCAVGRINS